MVKEFRDIQSTYSKGPQSYSYHKYSQIFNYEKNIVIRYAESDISWYVNLCSSPKNQYSGNIFRIFQKCLSSKNGYVKFLID